MNIIIRIPKDKYRPGIEEIIQSTVESMTKEQANIKVVPKS